MKLLDLLQMSSSNLLRRKIRTFLTILGVVIGTASIVVMLSLGLGLRRASMKQIEQSGGLTTIQVFPNEGMGEAGSTDNVKKAIRIDDKAIDKISQIPHVMLVSPVLEVSVLAKYRNFEAYISIRGMTQEALNSMNLKAAQGTLPAAGDTLQLFWGNQVGKSFYSSKGNAEVPRINAMKEQIFYIFDTGAYYEFKNPIVSSGEKENPMPPRPPKKYLIPVCGVLAGGEDEYSNNSYGALADIEALRTHLKKAFKNKAIPGQPTSKNGKPYKQLYYNSAYVRVDKIKEMEKVQKTLTELGFQVNSNTEWLKQVQEQMRTIQFVLGGIGAVSLFVASIGIANTMMMSIYERTKEIGILKVLGCDLEDVRRMFLMEAGFIGFSGGVAGLILSGGISAVINILAKNSSYENISHIPGWLVAVALIFAVLVGMVAGFFPALRAMRLSPLAALRTESQEFIFIQDFLYSFQAEGASLPLMFLFARHRRALTGVSRVITPEAQCR